MNHFKDCMEPTMDKTSRLLHYIYPLIERINPNLAEYLERFILYNNILFLIDYFEVY